MDDLEKLRTIVRRSSKTWQRDRAREHTEIEGNLFDHYNPCTTKAAMEAVAAEEDKRPKGEGCSRGGTREACE